MERRIVLCICVILCNITVSIISLATPYWIIIDDVSDINAGVDAYAGLWKGCVNDEDMTICKAVPKGYFYLKLK